MEERVSFDLTVSPLLVLLRTSWRPLNNSRPSSCFQSVAREERAKKTRHENKVNSRGQGSFPLLFIFFLFVLKSFRYYLVAFKGVAVGLAEASSGLRVDIKRIVHVVLCFSLEAVYPSKSRPLISAGKVRPGLFGQDIVRIRHNTAMMRLRLLASIVVVG